MQKISILIIVTCALNVNSASTDGKITQYFKSDVFKAFQKHWQAHRRSFENAILLALKENYGTRGMNVYVRRSADSLHLSDGFYVSDNVVELLLLNLKLMSLPKLTMPEVAFALASNVLRIEADLSKMIIEGSYILLRNESEILYSVPQDPFKNSPFSFQQVEYIGLLAIIAEGCSLFGYTLAKLSGQSVNLGHDTLQVKNCKFSVEITPSSYELPPVIAPYFSQEQSEQLEKLLTRPIREELIPKMQAAVFTYINTSVVFGDYLPKFREYQENLFRESRKNVTEFVRNINNITLNMKKETIEMEAVDVSWNFKCPSGSCRNYILVNNVTLYGLDTLYHSRMGGPFKLQSPAVAEAFRFNSIMVKGSTVFDDNNNKEISDFVADLKDVSLNFEVNIQEKAQPTFKFINWRTLDLSVIEQDRRLSDHKVISAYINGYILNKLPGVLENHLLSIYGQFGKTKFLNSNSYCNNSKELAD